MIEVSTHHQALRPGNGRDDVSFRVERGEILGFLGPNGAGKTTTMRILTGHAPERGARDGGRVRRVDKPMDAKRRTGYLPETPPLYPEMTVREYLDFVSRIKGVPGNDRKHGVSSGMDRTPSPTWPNATAGSSRRAIASAWAWRRR